MDGGYEASVPGRVLFAYTFHNDSRGQGSAEMNKKDLNERDICSKFITPAILKAGWDLASQIREEVRFTKGRIIVRGKLVTRGKDKRADYILYYKANIPIAIVEAKDNHQTMGAGLQQGLDYSVTLGTQGNDLGTHRAASSGNEPLCTGPRP